MENRFAALSVEIDNLDNQTESEGSDSDTERTDLTGQAAAPILAQSKSARRKIQRNEHRQKLTQRHDRHHLTQQLQSLLDKSKGRITVEVIALLERVDESIQRFVTSTPIDDDVDQEDATKTIPSGEMALPGMPAELREIFKTLASYYGLTAKSRGHHAAKGLVLYRSNQTLKQLPKPIYHDAFLQRALASKGINMQKIKQDALVKPKEGSLVGQASDKALDETNVGFRLLQGMGFDASHTTTDTSSTQEGKLIDVIYRDTRNRRGLGK